MAFIAGEPTETESTTLYVIEDDEALRETIRDIVTANGYRAEAFASALDFLTASPHDPNGCIVTDVRMPKMSGLDLLTKLSEARLRLPVVVVTGYADVPLAVEAMKLGAVDFLEKPFQSHELISAIKSALRQAGPSRSAEVQRDGEPSDLSGLSHREVEVLRALGLGLRNREIARRLGVSDRTVEAHKASVIKKTGAKTIADLYRLAATLPDPDPHCGEADPHAESGAATFSRYAGEGNQ